MTSYRFRILAALVILALPAPPSTANERHVAILVDTSGSMKSNDHQRYTKQLSQVISDLLDDDDRLTVVRMGSGRCSATASPGLALHLDPGDREDFKRRLEAHTRFNTGTNYSAAIRTALDVLGRAPEARRMLLILADSGGLGSCRSVLTRELVALRESGATIAAVNLGSTSGAFDSNPAFNFTTAALDAEAMVAAVAEIYQRFLGAKKVQAGRVAGMIEVRIAAHVGEAFLVVAADGPLGELRQGTGNPGAESIDFDHRGGGQTVGMDGRTRVYRIVRLQSPAAGRWSFETPGLSDPAGWMLLQDSALAVRLISPSTLTSSVDTPLEVELYDRTTGRRIHDPSAIPGLEVQLEIDGRSMTFQDDGQGGDRQAGDGILTAIGSFDAVGRQRLPIHIESDFLDRSLSLDVEVVEPTWALRVTSPARGEVSETLTLSVVLEAVGDPASLVPPESIDAVTGGDTPILRDDGQGIDERAGDLVYSAEWTPTAIGTALIEYIPRRGTAAPAGRSSLEVVGVLELGQPPAVDFGTLASKSYVGARLDLNNAEVRGVYQFVVNSDFQADRSVLEIDAGNGWETLDESSKILQLKESADNSWPLRLRVGECPVGTPLDRTFEIRLTATGVDGAEQKATVPIRVVIAADPWLKCWWPVLALLSGIVTAAVVIHGFWSPSRFPPRLGLVLSPEEDLGEGFFHPLRAQRGSGAGFYRDARLYVRPDFRLSASSRGAVARLRASGSQVRIQPVTGSTVWRQTTDEEWEALSEDETTARFGVLYRDELATLFFGLRNG